jgi:hypothetical protein
LTTKYSEEFYLLRCNAVWFSSKAQENFLGTYFSFKDNMSKKHSANWMHHTWNAMLGTSLGKGPQITNWSK